MSVIQRYLADENGASAVEYALVVFVLAVGLLPTLVTTRASIVGTYTTIANSFGK